MSNILATIPKGKYKDWAECEDVLTICDGEDDFWLINVRALPTKAKLGDLCYMIYDGLIRGYFTIIDTDLSENYRRKHRIGKRRTTKCIVLATWRPIAPIPHTGFQGFRYTTLRP